MNAINSDYKSNRRTNQRFRLSWAEVRPLALGAVASILLTLLAENVIWPVRTPLPCRPMELATAPAVERLPANHKTHHGHGERGGQPGNEEPRRHDDDNRALGSRREFTPSGSGAALFVLYGAYRGGAATFAVVGLGLKPLYTYGTPEFECLWAPSSPGQRPIKSRTARVLLPDMNYGRVYTVVVVNCTFDEPVGAGQRSRDRGGELQLHAYHGDGQRKPPSRIVALSEDATAYNASAFEAPYPYEILYCGSPLFGHVNARRIREWIAYHVRLFGPRSHFVFHDAGGMNADVMRALEPWRRLGYVSVEDVSAQAQYDGYYHNQFLILNDCLHRTRFLANWTFFFDVDEYVYIPPPQTFRAHMRQFDNHTALQFHQHRMSDVLCQDNSTANDTRFAFERLVYKDMDHEDPEKVTWKYALQSRLVYATGVHGSQKEDGHMEGEVAWAWDPTMHHYHYHNTINKDDESCMEVNVNTTSLDGTPYELDTSMTYFGSLVKQFELEHIGTYYNTSSY